MRRLLIPLAVAAAVVAVVVVLAHRSHGPKADLVWTGGPEVASLDPGKMTALGDHRVAAALFEGLTVLDCRDLRPRPGVAYRWDVSAARKTYTFHLRPAARWSGVSPSWSFAFGSAPLARSALTLARSPRRAASTSSSLILKS